MQKSMQGQRVLTRKSSHGEQYERKVAIDRLVCAAVCRLPGEGAAKHVSRNVVPIPDETYTMIAARRPCEKTSVSAVSAASADTYIGNSPYE